MTNRTMMLVLATLLTTTSFAALVPTASAGPCQLGAVCVNSEDCQAGAVCVGSDNCRLGAVCVGSENCRLGAVCVNDEDCSLGAVCIGSISNYFVVAGGAVTGNNFGRPCGTTALLALNYNNGAWTYSQYFSSAGSDAASPCSASTLSLNRAYSNSDAKLTSDGTTWTITRDSDTQFGQTREFTQLTFVEGGAYFTQLFTSQDGRPVWQADGFLASPQAL